eukprot:3163602-Rhodomonas_salina.1
MENSEVGAKVSPYSELNCRSPRAHSRALHFTVLPFCPVSSLYWNIEAISISSALSQRSASLSGCMRASRCDFGCCESGLSSPLTLADSAVQVIVCSAARAAKASE